MPRATPAVGRNVLRKEGASKDVGRREVHRRPVVSGHAARADDPVDHPGGRDRRHPLQLRHHRLHHRRLPRHPRPQPRRADRGRPAVPGRARDPPCRRADPAAGARGSRDPARRRRADRLHAVDAGLRSRQPRRRCSRRSASRRAASTKDSRSPTSSSKASTAWGTRSSSTSRPTASSPMPGNGVPDDVDGITVYGSMQCPYYVHRALMVLMGLPGDKVRVVQTETGGGFGGKEEYPSMIAGHAALLARKSGRPVKLIYDRVEDMIATTKRHPAIVRHKTGVTRDGTADRHRHRRRSRRRRLRDVERGRAVARRDSRQRAVPLRSRPHPRPRDDDQHAAQRRVPRLRRAADAVRGRSAHGSHRGGARLDPVRLREINALRPGDTTATGQRLGQDCSALAGAARGGEADGFQARRRSVARSTRPPPRLRASARQGG